MKKSIRKWMFVLLFLVVFLVSSCSKTAENEHLPEYCQTYSNFTSFASKDFYDLLIEQDIEIDKTHYLDAIAVLDLEFVVDDPNRSIDLSGIQCFQNLTDISLTGQSFKDLSPISALTNIQIIELNNTSVVSIDSFQNLSKIKSLTIKDTDTLQSVSGVEEMTKLTYLDLSNNGIVNIEGLNNLVNLTALYLNDNQIIEFPSINKLKDLTTLDISNNNISILGNDLSGLTALENLNAENNMICDISSFADLISLEVLNLSHNDLGCNGASPNFDSLQNAPNLRELYLDNNGLTSISGLKDRNISLETLYLNNNELNDLSPIAQYTDIVTLHIENNNIESITDLSGMTSLTGLYFANNNISDISNIAPNTNLEEIDLSNNNISVIPDIKVSWPNLIYLDLSSNTLTDTSGVEGHQNLETLILYNNALEELSGINNLPSLDTLVIFDEDVEPELEDQRPNTIHVIRDSFYNVPELTLHVDNVFDFGFAFEDDLEIINSIKGIEDVYLFQFENRNIKSIDEDSLDLPDLTAIYVEGNNLSDLRFILGNPSLQQVRVNGNPIANLQIFSGLNTSDLDNLTGVQATDIDVDNNLVDAFIDLPSIQSIDLTNTSIVSVENSFNGLSSLTVMNLMGDNLTKIVDSFNNIYGVYDPTNYINFENAHIEEISGSFNNGNYSYINIRSQTTESIDTKIIDSFNDITVETSTGIDLSGSKFETITGSFNRVETNSINISNSFVELLNTSFDDSVLGILDLSNNYIQDIPLLNEITSVEEVYLQNNVLTTLAFLDTIDVITTLNISSQISKEEPYISTLVSFNGVNNMPTLTNLIYDQIVVTEIDGLKNTGITEFNLSYEAMFDNQLTLVTDDSFDQTNLTYLNLSGHELTDLDFLDNLGVLENLYIGVDVASLAAFNAQNFDSTLQTLAITNVQGITDYAALATYDALTSLAISTPGTTIENLDGMDSLVTLVMNRNLITSISNSFNAMPNLSITQSTIIDDFTALTSIVSSFDVYGVVNQPDTVSLVGSIDIDDSFNNVIHVILNDNDNSTEPNFDTASFDNMESIALEYADFDNYNFLNNYTSLTEVTIGNLGTNILDLANESILTLTIVDSESDVDTLTVDLHEASALRFTSFNVTSLTINADSIDYTIQTDDLTTNVTLSTNADTMKLVVRANDFTLVNDSVQSIELGYFDTVTTTFSTSLLSTLTRSTNMKNATTFTVNSDEITLSYDTTTDNLIINNNNATTYTVNALNGTLTINNDEPDLTLTVDASALDINYDTLHSVTLSGNVNDVNVSSLVLTTYSSDANSSTATITSNQASLSVTGTATNTVTITDNVINNLTVNAPLNTVELLSSNNETLQLDIDAELFSLQADSIPSITITNGSVLETLSLTNNDALHTVTYGTVAITTIDFTTLETVITVTGDSGNVILDGAAFTDITVDVPNGTVDLFSAAASLEANINAESVTFDRFSNVTNLSLDNTNTITTLTIDESATIASIDARNATVTNLGISSTTNTLSVIGANIATTTIDGTAFTSVTIDVGTNVATVASSNLGALSIDFVSGTTSLSGNYTNLTIDTNSVIDSLNLSSNVLTNITGNAADITTLNVTSSAANLDVIGSAISTFTINQDVATLDLLLSNTTTVDITSGTGVAVSTNTDAISLQADGNSSVNSSVLNSIVFDMGTNDLTLDLDNTALTLSLDGTAHQVNITGDDIDTVTLSSTTDITQMIFNYLDINGLNLTEGAVDSLDIYTSKTNFTLQADETTNITIYADNATSLTVNSNNTGSSLVINSALNGSLELSGSGLDNTIVNADSLTGLTFNAFSTSNLYIDSNNLTTLSTGSSVSDIVDITTIQALFTINGSFDTLQFDGPITGTLDITSDTITSISTLSEIVDVTITSNTFTLSGDNIQTVNGSVKAIQINNTDTVVTLNVVATDTVQLSNNVITSLTLSDPSIYTTLDIDSTSLLTITSGDATVSTFDITGNGNTITLSSNKGDLDILASGVDMVLDTPSLQTITGSFDGVDINTTESIFHLNLTNADGIVEIISDTMTTLNIANTTTLDQLLIDSNSIATVNAGLAAFQYISFTGNNQLVTVHSDNTSLALYTSTVDLSVNASNLENISGNLGNLSISDTATTLSIDIISNGVVDIDNNIVTTMTLDANTEIATLDVASTTLVTINSSTATVSSFVFTGNNNDVTYNASVASLDMDITNADIIINNSALTTLIGSFESVTIEEGSASLSIDATALDTLFITSSTIQTITTGSTDFTTLYFDSDGSTSVVTLNTNKTTLDVNTIGALFRINAPNLTNISGTGNLIELVSGDTVITIDMTITDTMSIDYDTLTTVNISLTTDISTLDILSDGFTTLNANSATMDTVTITTQNDLVDINADTATLVTVHYEGLTGLTIDVETTELVLNVVSDNTIAVSGTMTNASITGNSLTSVTTTGFVVSNSFTMNNTLVDDLEFASGDLLGSVTSMTINTLDSANLETIMAKLDTYEITVDSPLTMDDIYDYYYGPKYDDLEAQETIDNERETRLEEQFSNAAWDVIVANQYMDHLDQTNTINNEIVPQTYQLVDDYYQSYLTNDGIDEATLTQQQIDAIKDSIQGVLDDPALTFDITQEVITEMEDEADTYATNQVNAKSYTLV